MISRHCFPTPIMKPCFGGSTPPHQTPKSVGLSSNVKYLLFKCIRMNRWENIQIHITYSLFYKG